VGCLACTSNRWHPHHNFKTYYSFFQDYYCHPTSKYSIVVRIIVDCNKTFFDVYVGLPNNLNDSKILCRFVLCCCGQYQNLFDPNKGVEGIHLYLLGDEGYGH